MSLINSTKKSMIKRLISNTIMKIWTRRLLVLRKIYMSQKLFNLIFWNNLNSWNLSFTKLRQKSKSFLSKTSSWLKCKRSTLVIEKTRLILFLATLSIRFQREKKWKFFSLESQKECINSDRKEFTLKSGRETS